MIRMKPLLFETQTSIDEASEELYGIRPQPLDTCPIINGIKTEAKKLLGQLHGYERLNDANDIDKLYDILWNVKYFLEDNLVGGSECAIELVRANAQNIRAWGQEWKDYAKKLTLRFPHISNRKTFRNGEV